MAETTPYVKQTWTDGVSSASAARLTVIEEGVRAAHEQPAVHVYHNATQSATTATDLVLAFNTERFDTAFGSASTMHDNVTNNSRLTCRHAGIYQVTATITWTANATGLRFLWLRVNGTAGQQIGDAGQVASSTLNTPLTATSLLQLAVNDFVTAIAWQNSGAGLNVTASTAANMNGAEFMMVRVA